MAVPPPDPTAAETIAADGTAAGHRLSLPANLSWNLAGKVTFAASQWGVLVVLARLGSVALVGQYALGLAITAPVMLFAHLGARHLLASEREFAFGFRDYLTMRLMSLPVAFVCVLAIALAAGYPPTTFAVIAAIAAAKLVEGITDICYGAAQWSERMRQIATSLALRGALALVTMAGLVRLTGSAAAGAAGVAAVWAVVLVAYDLPRAKHSLELTAHSPRGLGSWPAATAEGRARLRRLLVLALPLGVTAPLMSLQVNVPRYAVDTFLGTESLGIFAALGYLLMAGSVTVMALGQPVLPRLTRLAASGEKDAFWRLLGRLGAFGAMLGLGGAGVAALFGEPLLRLLYGPEYAAHSTVLVWLCLASAPAFVGSFLYQGLLAVRVLKVQPVLYGSNVVLVSVLSLLIVPAEGLVGAAWAYGLTMLLQVMGLLVLVHRGLTRAMRAHAPAATPPALG